MPTVEQLNSLFSARTQTRQPSVHSRQFGPTCLSWAPADETGNFCSERLDRSAAAAALTVKAAAPPTESRTKMFATRWINDCPTVLSTTHSNVIDAPQLRS
jgi:hypothetical protein